MHSARLALSFGALLIASLVPIAAAGERSKSVRVYTSRTANAYLLSMGDGKSFLSMNASMEEIDALRRRFSEDFLWVRRAKRTYLLLDAGTLQQARALFEPMRALDPDLEAVRRLRAPIESRRRELDREQEEVEREAEGRRSADRDELDRRKRSIRERSHELRAEERRVDSLQNALEQRREEIETRAEAELWRLIDASIDRGLARRIEED